MIRFELDNSLTIATCSYYHPNLPAAPSCRDISLAPMIVYTCSRSPITHGISSWSVWNLLPIFTSNADAPLPALLDEDPDLPVKLHNYYK